MNPAPSDVDATLGIEDLRDFAERSFLAAKFLNELAVGLQS